VRRRGVRLPSSRFYPLLDGFAVPVGLGTAILTLKLVFVVLSDYIVVADIRDNYYLETFKIPKKPNIHIYAGFMKFMNFFCTQRRIKWVYPHSAYRFPHSRFIFI
jgi:hypothetical protein